MHNDKANHLTMPRELLLVVLPQFLFVMPLIPYSHHRTLCTPVQIRTAIKGLEDLGPSVERQGHCVSLARQLTDSVEPLCYEGICQPCG